MAAIEIFLISALRAIVEVVGLCLLGRGVLSLLAGPARSGNVIYQMFLWVTNPALGLIRRITPKVILDRHLPALGFILLFWFWIALALARLLLCEANGLVCA